MSNRRFSNTFAAKLLGELSRVNVPRSAAALTYYFVLSLFPLLICVHACVGLFHADVTALLDSLDRVLPEQTLLLAKDYVDYLSQMQSPLLLPTGVMTILLSGSAGVRVLLEAMDEFYGRERQIGLRRVCASVLFSFLLLVAMYLSAVVVLTGDWLFRAMRVDLGRFPGLWLNLRYLLLFGFILLLVMALYRLGAPRGGSGWISVVCALMAAAALVAASMAFSWFISMSTRYSLLYGSLASIIILLVWLYLCGMILLLGAFAAAVWSRWREQK